MFKVYRKEFDFAGKKVTLETGKIARQADGAVLATMGGTTVLCTVVGARSIKEGQDFFPLSVHYQEKAYAAGKIPGGFFKREARPSEFETLTSRLIDRPIRPLFPETFLNEVQIIATVVSHDLETPADIVAMLGCSAALTISGIPFMGPIAGARVAYVDGKYVINPSIQESENSILDLIVAGTKEGVLMVESEAQELTEEIMLGAVMAGWNAFQEAIDGIIGLAEMAAKDPWPVPTVPAPIAAMATALKAKYEKELGDAYLEKIKLTRQEKVAAVKEKAVAEFVSDTVSKEAVGNAFFLLESAVVRGRIIKDGSRIDGRNTTTVRPIVSEVGVLPRTHGSALFTRGETQALVVATLGTGQDEQIMDTLVGEYKQRFMLHYNFPSYSVGEVGRMSPPGRREIGHGKLAWRAINPLLPKAADFPYTMRIVSEITESNGSSSMATVCGTSLAMMDAGVPLVRPVAGIAMGLIKEGKDFAVISDILGDEDHLGDMDFKVAGTERGITALQMDIKITSITEEIMTIAVKQAREGRLHILAEMAKAMTQARTELSEFAPQIATLIIPKDKIRDVIGTGGKIIREIIEKTGCKIDIEDDGTVKVAATDQKSIDEAIKIIRGLTEEPEVGIVYDGKVVKTTDFGAFVNFMPGKDGLVHISELADQRVAKTTDVVKEGDMVKVLIVGFDDRGKIKLSMKRVNQENGEILVVKEKPAREERESA